MPIDVNSLLEQRVELESKAPTRGFNPEIVKFLGDEAKWDVFACLLGYAESKQNEIPQVLEEIPTDLPDDPDDWTVPFLTYCAGYKQSSDSHFAAAVKKIKSNPDAVALMKSSVIRIEYCLRKYPNDNEAFLKCLQE